MRLMRQRPDIREPSGNSIRASYMSVHINESWHITAGELPFPTTPLITWDYHRFVSTVSSGEIADMTTISTIQKMIMAITITAFTVPYS